MNITENIIFLLYILLCLSSIILNLKNHKVLFEINFFSSVTVYIILLHLGMNMENIYKKILILLVMIVILVKEYRLAKILKR